MQSWNIVLDYAARQENFAVAETTLQRMENLGYEPDVLSYSCLVRAYVPAGQPETAAVARQTNVTIAE